MRYPFLIIKRDIVRAEKRRGHNFMAISYYIMRMHIPTSLLSPRQRWESKELPAYSPDLAQCDCLLIASSSLFKIYFRPYILFLI
jgi:hypothetical protein